MNTYTPHTDPNSIYFVQKMSKWKKRTINKIPDVFTDTKNILIFLALKSQIADVSDILFGPLKNSNLYQKI